MSAYHSIWLMPAEEDLRYFRDIVNRLSAQFGTEVFCPHLTLVEDMRRPSKELSKRARELVAGRSALTLPIENIVGTTLFYRSLYAAFPSRDDLLSLKRRAIGLFRKGDIESFQPHVSLAYGAPSGDEKSATIAGLSSELSGRHITFDSVVVAASAQSIPVSEWQTISRHDLMPAETMGLRRR